MTGKDIFKIWAPVGSKWTDWARPVPFIEINELYKINSIMNFIIHGINYINGTQKNTAVILDLPGCDSIKEGVALAALGFRPIPLYNGTNEQKGAMALVDNHSITSALIWGASELEKLKINIDAPPAFLLDSNRTHRFKMNDSVFDNSWDLFPQDIPSPEFFLANGINKIIIRGEKIDKDLRLIFIEFQKKGLNFFFTNGYEKAKEIKIKKPIRFIQ